MRLCLDTNIFFSFQKNLNIGNSPSEVIEFFSRLAQTHPHITLHAPPTIMEELSHMFDVPERHNYDRLSSLIHIQSPDLKKHVISAYVFCEYIQECRNRNMQGQHIGAELIERAALLHAGAPKLGRVEFQKSLQPLKESFRERYRNATRTGILDSLADVDLILLALEIDAYVVSADEGIVTWARKLGAKEIELSTLRRKIEHSGS